MEGRPKKLPIPFEPSNFPALLPGDSPSILQKLANESPEEFSIDGADEGRVTQDLDEILALSKDQLTKLEVRASLLQNIIQNQFGIENPEKWLAEQSESKAKETKPITLTLYITQAGSVI